jgi:N-acetylneuraminic acid mutarotase
MSDMHHQREGRDSELATRSRVLTASETLSRARIESLEPRTMLHGGDEGVIGSVEPAWVPWLTPSWLTVTSPAPTPTPTPTPSPTPTPTPVTAFTKVNWSTNVPRYSQAKTEALKAVVDDRIYVFGGFVKDADGEGPVAGSDYYDTTTNTWHKIADLPRAFTHVGMAVDGHDVYMCGGYYGTKLHTYAQVFSDREVWVYNTDTNTYRQTTPLPVPVAGGGAAIVGRMLHYYGGYKADRSDATYHFVMDLDHQDQGWHTAAPIPMSRSHVAAVQLDGKLYAVGGQTGIDPLYYPKADVQVYDPATDTWSTAASMPQPLSHIHSSTFVMGGRIIVIGGDTDVGGGPPQTAVLAYDPTTNKWTKLTDLPSGRIGAVAGQVNGTIYVLTGRDLQSQTRIADSLKGIPVA